MQRLGLESVEVVCAVLDYLDLREQSHKLTVIGGAAMAAHGLKSMWDTDLDIAITPELDTELRHGEQSLSSSGEATILPRRGRSNEGLQRFAEDARTMPHLGLVPITGLIFPFDDRYKASSEDLIMVSEKLYGSPYSFLPLPHVKSIKEALVGSPTYAGNKQKHRRDIATIDSYLRTTAS